MLHVGLFAAYSCVYGYGCNVLNPLAHSFIFNPCSGSSEEPIVFDLFGYDVYMDYGDDVTGIFQLIFDLLVSLWRSVQVNDVTNPLNPQITGSATFKDLLII